MRFRAALALLLVAGLYLGIVPRVHGDNPISLPVVLPGAFPPDPDDFQFDPWDIPDPPDVPFPPDDPFDDIPPLPDPFEDPFNSFPDPPPDLPPLPTEDFPPSTFAPPANGKVQRSLAMGAVPFATGHSTQPSQASYTIFVRQAGGTYLSLQRQSTPPYHLLSPASEVLQSLAGGLKNLLNGPPGPAGTGLQSQGSATAADKSGPVVATAGTNSVTVNQSTNGKFTTLTYLIGPDVNSVFFADFNGDGSPDLAVAFDGSGAAVPGGIAILLNKGDGTFASPVIYGRGAPATQFFPSGTPATHFVVYDLNHDGALDIATASLGGTVTVLLGKGDGTFGPPVQYAVGGSGQAIAVADFNGDGVPDIAAGGATGILLGNGDGTFRAGPPLPAVASGSLIWAFAAGDLNGDGKMDLVYADTQNQIVAPLFGNGDGSFRAGQAYTVSQMPDSLVLTDYNHDGRLDIVNGAGDARCFGPSDGSGRTNILLNNGDETFQGIPTYFSLPNAEAAGYGFTHQNGLATGKFGGTFPGVLVSGAGALTLFPGDGKGGFHAPQAIALSGQPGAIAVADFNGDGMPDAAVANGAGIAILLGNAGGLAAPTVLSTGGLYPADIVSGDFDGDGKADLVFVSQSLAGGSSPGTLAFLKGNGDGTFQAPITIPAGLTPLSLSAVDLNGDGKLDLIFSDSGTNGVGGAVYVAMNLGGGAFHAPVKVFPAFHAAFGIGDVNEDGKLDLVATSDLVGSGESAVSWLPGNGDGTFQAPIVISTSADTDTAILLHDFNGDGHLDIVLGNQGSETTFMTGNGTGTFSAEMRFLSAAQTEPMFMATADLNGDGKPDLIVAGLTISVLLNRPATSIAIQTNPAGLKFIVDGGAAYTAPQTVGLSQGPHIIVEGPQAGTTGTRWAFTGWSDGGAAAHMIAMGATPATYTASFATQYQLTISASPAAGGTVTPAPSGFYNPGTIVPVTATAKSGYSFTNWTGAVASASSSSTTVTMSAAQALTANFLASGGPVIQSVDTANGGPNIAQNTFIVIKGANLVPATTPAAGVIWSSAPSFASGEMPTQLNGVSVTVNGKPAYIYFFCSAATSPVCTSDQLNVLTPLDNSTGPVPVVVTSGATASATFTAALQAVAPAFLLFPGNYVAATHANGGLLGPASLYPGASTPAQPGEEVVIYAVGFGLPSAPLTAGSSAQSGSLPVLPVCTIGTNLAAVAFAGLTSPGLYQLNIVIPAGTPNGNQSISCTYGGSATPAGDLIAVGQ